jgi:hypothetical protein
MDIHLCYFHLINNPQFGKPFFSGSGCITTSFSFTVDDLTAEKGDEASSDQALSEENRAKLK